MHSEQKLCPHGSIIGAFMISLQSWHSISISIPPTSSSTTRLTTPSSMPVGSVRVKQCPRALKNAPRTLEAAMQLRARSVVLLAIACSVHGFTPTKISTGLGASARPLARAKTSSSRYAKKAKSGARRPNFALAEQSGPFDPCVQQRSATQPANMCCKNGDPGRRCTGLCFLSVQAPVAMCRPGAMRCVHAHKDRHRISIS